MLRSRNRVAALTVLVLFSLIVYPSLSQEPAKPGGTNSRIKALQQERLDTARELVKQQTLRLQNGQGLLAEILEATRILAEAELDVCQSDAERAVALAKILGVAKESEKMADVLAKSGQGRVSAALAAKEERLRFEIALERAKAKLGAPQKGVAVAEAPAKVNKGGPPRAIMYRATIQAYETVNLHARVSGYLRNLNVDIGDRVKRGQMLAAVDVPELEAQLRYEQAVVSRERSRAEQAKSRIRGAEADLATARLGVKQAEATVKSAAALTQFRDKQRARMKDLAATKSIDERLADESKDRHQAALEAERSAKSAVAVAEAQVVAAANKIDQAKTDLVVMEADIKVALARLEKSQVLLSFATIMAPFDGIISQRSYFPGEFISSAESAKKAAPILTVYRTDRLRVSVSVPGGDVPFVNVGDAVDVEIDAYPGKKWSAKISRAALALDPRTDAMAVEIDLPNATGQIHPGMTATVTVMPDRRQK